MASYNYKRYLPTVLIVAAFFVIAIMYAYPALSGKELAAGDNISWKGMSHEAKAWYEKTGEQVLWTNSMFGGMPTYLFYLAKTANYINAVEEFFVAILPKPAFFFFLAMACFFALMRVLGVNRWLSAIGAIAYTFATYNPIIISAGHDTKMLSIGYLPGVLAGILLIYRGRRLLGAAVTGLLFALMFEHQHLQVMFYFGMIALCLVGGLLYIAVKEGKVKQWVIASAIAGGVMALGAGPSMPGFLSSIEYSKETMRGGKSELTLNHDKGKKSGGLDKDYAFQWSNSIGESFCILIPRLYGGASEEEVPAGSHTYERLVSLNVPEESAEQATAYLPTYWGPQQFLGGPVYFGAIICMLFVLGLMLIRSPHKWWMAGLCLLAIVMSWGDNFPGFNYFLFDTIPMLNKFRTPTMVLVIPQFLFSVIAFWGLNEVVSGKVSMEEFWKRARTALIITGGLCLLLALAGNMIFSFRGTRYNGSTDEKLIQKYSAAFGGNSSDANAMAQTKTAAAKMVEGIHEDRASMAMKSGLRSALFIALAGGLIWAYSRKKIKPQLFMAGLALLIVADLMPNAWRYLNDRNYQDPEQYDEAFKPGPTDLQIYEMSKDKRTGAEDPYYRVLDLTKDVYNDARQALFHKCIGGYNPAKLEIYQDLINVHMGGRSFNPQVLNMLNTRFVVMPGQQGGGVVQENPDACGNAWFVGNVKQVNTADEEMLSLGDTAREHPGQGFDAKETAVVRSAFAAQLQGLQAGKDSSAGIRLAKYGLDEISYASSNPREGLAVFSDIWYPHGWKAYVDGKETPIVRANYVLRALRLPAGQHNIVFKFHPQKFYTGNAIAGISSVLLYLLLIGGIVAIVRSQKSEVKPEEEVVVQKAPPAKR